MGWKSSDEYTRIKRNSLLYRVINSRLFRVFPRSFSASFREKKGQVLLITVMLLAIVSTVVLSVSFKSINETKISKLEEENQKALAAAEAALEEALRTNQNAIIGQGGLTNFTNISGTANLQETTSNTFTTANIVKDGSYTFYLAQYNQETKTIEGQSLAQDITICYKALTTTKPALEITLLKDSGLKKYVIDQEARINNAFTPSSFCSTDNSFNTSYVIPAADIGVDSKILYVKVLYSPAKIMFKRNSNFPSQGRTAYSSVQTKTGVTKKVELFQSYPQIPAGFFDTSF